MDINRLNYYDHLPTILKRVSNAHFISFDLELSGIPTWGKRTGQSRATLQERYTELKAAAEKYQILQIGFTIVEEDKEDNRYALRPFNFNLSPLIEDDRDVDIERDIVYSSSAVNFLRNANYDMSSPFSSGVPYLTRQETEKAWQRATLKHDRKSIPDIQISASDTQANEFMKRVRQEITQWQLTKKPKLDSFEVTANDDNGSSRPLNRFQKRLVHQIVRSDFPKLQSISQSESVKIKNKRSDPVDKDQEPWRKYVANAICHQTGFRWIAEAIAAGKLDDLDPALCGRRIAGELDAPTRKDFARRLREIIAKCVATPKLFYGELPNNVEDFQATVHSTFPLVFDTKYMVTTGAHSDYFRGSQLWEVDQAFENQKEPIMYLPNDQSQYSQEQREFHQAGFDSFVTAKVFLRLAARFDPASHVNDSLEPEIKTMNRQRAQKENLQHEAGLSSAFISNNTAVKAIESLSDPSNIRSSSEIPSQNRLALNNIFDTLSDSDMEAATEQVENPVSNSQASKPDSIESLTRDINELQVLPGKSTDARADSPHVQEVAYELPQWDNEFWDTYRNKLRVFGTVEEACDLESKQRHADPIMENEESASVLSWVYNSFKRFLL